MLKKLFILSADDDQDDQELIEEALQLTGIDHHLTKVSDGLKLLNFLQDLSDNHEKLPDIIFLDLNMPFVTGRDAVKIIKADQSPYRAIPVIILTTSSSKEDMYYCTQSGADQYLVKPNSFSELKKVLQHALTRFLN